MSSVKNKENIRAVQEYLRDPVNQFTTMLALAVGSSESVVGTNVVVAALSQLLGRYITRVAKEEHRDAVLETVLHLVELHTREEAGDQEIEDTVKDLGLN